MVVSGAMLPELVTYLRTPCPRPVRAVGYLYEAIAMQARYRRGRAYWQAHLEESRRVILRAATKCPRKETVQILGSGLLLDVPLAQLAHMFQEVVLVDIVHLPAVKRKIRPFKNVRLEQADLSGIVQSLWEGRGISNGRLPDVPRMDLNFAGTQACLSVSLNLLSQLPLMPRQYVRKHMRGVPEDDLEVWCRALVCAHDKALRVLNHDVCLIADYGYRLLDGQKILEKGTTLFGIELPPPEQAWTWHIAPRGELSKSFSKELQVGAWFLTPGE